MAPSDDLRVLDFDRVSALRSQTLWHAIAHGVSSGAASTLSFLRPASPYVSLGFHRRLAEVDTAECARRGVPIYRRMVGGGPVWCDDGQQFFQITVPADRVPAGRTRALRFLLEPAVTAFHAVGVDARLDEHGEIAVGDRKVCGHGAGQIGDAVVVVGNLIERFDHEAAAAVLAFPDDAARAEGLRLMRRYVQAMPANAAGFRRAAADAYADALGLSARPGMLTATEQAWLSRLDRRFCEPAWVAGPSQPTPRTWATKVRAGVWVVAGRTEGTEVVASIVGDAVAAAVVRDTALNGTTSAVEAALRDAPLAQVESRLEAFGQGGRRVASALAAAAGGRA